jgi:acetyl esterase/lipase
MRVFGRLMLSDRLSWETQRARLDRSTGSIPLPKGTTTTRIDLGGVEAERVDGPSTARPSPTGEHTERDAADRLVVHLHGGGYCAGSPALARGFAARLAAEVGAPVLLPDYRLAPEHPHPAALSDALAAWRAATADVPAGRVVLAGDSAGAGLALACVHALSEAGEPLPAGLVMISPWLDLTVDRAADAGLARRDPVLAPRWLERCADAYTSRPGVRRDDAAVSPGRVDPAGLPPTLVLAGADDVLVPDADRFVPAAHAAGVDVRYTRVPGLWHNYPFQVGMLAAADRALAQVAAFVTALCPAGGGADSGPRDHPAAPLSTTTEPTPSS